MFDNKTRQKLWLMRLPATPCKEEIFLEQREVAFLSPSKICENLNFGVLDLFTEVYDIMYDTKLTCINLINIAKLLYVILNL